jgi:hypothetical protein
MPKKTDKKTTSKWSINPFVRIDQNKEAAEKAKKATKAARPKSKPIDYAARVKERPPRSGTTKTTTVKAVAPKKAVVKPAPKKASTPTPSRRSRKR